MNPSHFVALAVCALLVVAVVCDLRARTIPDTVSLALLALALLATWRGWHPVTFAQLGLGLAAGFAVGAALFYLSVMGGGDAKLCAGLGAVCGWSQLLEVLFATALCGGLLSLYAKRRGMTSVPYAPAFAGGYAATLAIAGGLPPSAGLWDLVTGGRP